MISFFQGDIFEADVEAIVNPVNTVGVMGKGLAREFRDRFPENTRVYQKACRQGQVRIGDVLVVPCSRPGSALRFIINFPTKDHWRNPSEYSFIASGLVDLVRVVEELKVSSIAIPALGAGLGGLEWRRVSELLRTTFEATPDIRVLVYEPL